MSLILLLIHRLATMFNKFFRKKVKKPPTVPPTERLKKWLETRGHPPPPFSLRKIDLKTLRMIMKILKV